LTLHEDRMKNPQFNRRNAPTKGIREFYIEPYERPKYEGDSLPENTTVEDLHEKYDKLVWCDYYACFWNARPEGLNKTVGSVLNNSVHKPLGANDGWQGICGRPEEIALRFKQITTSSGAKQNVPYCFTPANNGKTGHVDFSRLLQPNGSPYGGSIDSQHATVDNSFEGYI